MYVCMYVYMYIYIYICEVQREWSICGFDNNFTNYEFWRKRICCFKKVHCQKMKFNCLSELQCLLSEIQGFFEIIVGEITVRSLYKWYDDTCVLALISHIIYTGKVCLRASHPYQQISFVCSGRCRVQSIPKSLTARENNLHPYPDFVRLPPLYYLCRQRCSLSFVARVQTGECRLCASTPQWSAQPNPDKSSLGPLTLFQAVGGVPS